MQTLKYHDSETIRKIQEERQKIKDRRTLLERRQQDRIYSEGYSVSHKLLHLRRLQEQISQRELVSQERNNKILEHITTAVHELRNSSDMHSLQIAAHLAEAKIIFLGKSVRAFEVYREQERRRRQIYLKETENKIKKLERTREQNKKIWEEEMRLKAELDRKSRELNTLFEEMKQDKAALIQQQESRSDDDIVVISKHGRFKESDTEREHNMRKIEIDSMSESDSSIKDEMIEGNGGFKEYDTWKEQIGQQIGLSDQIEDSFSKKKQEDAILLQEKERQFIERLSLLEDKIKEQEQELLEKKEQAQKRSSEMQKEELILLEKKQLLQREIEGYHRGLHEIKENFYRTQETYANKQILDEKKRAHQQEMDNPNGRTDEHVSQDMNADNQQDTLGQKSLYLERHFHKQTQKVEEKEFEETFAMALQGLDQDSDDDDGSDGNGNEVDNSNSINTPAPGRIEGKQNTHHDTTSTLDSLTSTMTAYTDPSKVSPYPSQNHIENSFNSSKEHPQRHRQSPQQQNLEMSVETSRVQERNFIDTQNTDTESSSPSGSSGSESLGVLRENQFIQSELLKYLPTKLVSAMRTLTDSIIEEMRMKQKQKDSGKKKMKEQKKKKKKLFNFGRARKSDRNTANVKQQEDPLEFYTKKSRLSEPSTGRSRMQVIREASLTRPDLTGIPLTLRLEALYDLVKFYPQQLIPIEFFNSYLLTIPVDRYCRTDLRKKFVGSSFEMWDTFLHYLASMGALFPDHMNAVIEAFCSALLPMKIKSASDRRAAKKRIGAFLRACLGNGSPDDSSDDNENEFLNASKEKKHTGNESDDDYSNEGHRNRDDYIQKFPAATQQRSITRTKIITSRKSNNRPKLRSRAGHLFRSGSDSDFEFNMHGGRVDDIDNVADDSDEDSFDF